jgi:hypothetical protein
LRRETSGSASESTHVGLLITPRPPVVDEPEALLTDLLGQVRAAAAIVDAFEEGHDVADEGREAGERQLPARAEYSWRPTH